jgi:uncharacterized protein
MDKIYITAEDLLTDSFRMALDIFASGYRPDFIVGVWRGGTPIGIAVQEMLGYLGVETDHIAIRSSSYTGIGARGKEVQVHGLGYLEEKLRAGHSLLLVDDVFDSGLSLQKIIQELQLRCASNTPEIKIATPYYKPGNNQTTMKPDFYLHESADWLVFPHELKGLTIDEVLQNKPELQPLHDRLLTLLKS